MKFLVIFIIFIFAQSCFGVDWLHSFDLDGDGKNDQIDFDFTGGGHCCYKPKITLSRTARTTKFPFQIDGGYVGGIVDDSQPWKFDIRNVDNDALPEVLMKIESYNAELYPIPKKWTRHYGFKTNFIVIEYEKEKLRVRDQTEAERIDKK